MTPPLDVLLLVGYLVVAGLCVASGLRNRDGERNDCCPVCETETLAGQTYCHRCRTDLGGPVEGW